MVSVTINGDLTGDVTGDPPNMAGGQLIVGDGTLPLISQNWEITTPPANGTASIDADTGEWTYTVDPAFFDSLDDNEVVFDTFFVQVTGAVEIAGFAVPYGSDPTEISIRIEGVCFTSGTLIDTPNGSRLIETLTVGDVITTADRGAQPIRWIESSYLTSDRLDENPAMRPVRLTAGSLGPGNPRRDLLVSQQHRILVRGPKTQLLFGASEVLVAAKHLCGWPGIDIDISNQPVEYVHLLMDRHEILIAEGAMAESLFLGEEALYTISSDALRELAEIFPNRITQHECGLGLAARRILREHEARMLV